MELGVAKTPAQEMTTESERKKWIELCANAAVEQDPNRLLELVKEINQILEAQDKLRKNAPGQQIQ